MKYYVWSPDTFNSNIHSDFISILVSANYRGPYLTYQLLNTLIRCLFAVKFIAKALMNPLYTTLPSKPLPASGKLMRLNHNRMVTTMKTNKKLNYAAFFLNVTYCILISASLSI